MTTPLLDIRDLHAGYGKAEVLHGIDLHAVAGQVITVIGPNGAGKTTLLNTLMGLLPTRGKMFYRGEDISAFTLEERVMMGIALVPEKRELFGTMTVEDNLELGGFRQMRKGNRQWRSRMDDVYDLFPRLKERLHQDGTSMSGGEQQMLAIARAMIGKPKVILLDEPSEGIMPVLVDEMFELFANLKQKGLTILLVEQNVQQALKISDRAYILDQGEIVFHDTAQNLLNNDEIQQKYCAV